MKTTKCILWVFVGFFVLTGCGKPQDNTGPRYIRYWEKWTGFEGEAASAMVDAFNEKEREKAAQNPGYRPIEVSHVTTSKIEEKLLVAIAGGDPPDVAGLYSFMLCSYAQKGALTDLTDLLAGEDITRKDYIPIFWDMCEYKGRMWAVPTTPATTALHWNKRLFREAGLDPERPPKTLAELDAMAEQLTVWEVTHEDGRKDIVRGYPPQKHKGKWRLVSAGFLPNEPGWWNWSWGFYFNGKLWDGQGNITVNDTGTRAAFEWIASYSHKLGVDVVQRFKSGFGNFSSPQNAFMSNKVAMEIQGVWMYNFIHKYAPGMEWGAAACPGITEDMLGVNNAEADILIIPKDSPHPEEAFEFVKFVCSQEGMEIICMGQRKFSPLAHETEHFRKTHPHPYISLFRDLAKSPHAFSTPQMGIWSLFKREMGVTFERVQNLNATPDEALTNLRIKMQKNLDREIERSKRRWGS